MYVCVYVCICVSVCVCLLLHCLTWNFPKLYVGLMMFVISRTYCILLSHCMRKDCSLSHYLTGISDTHFHEIVPVPEETHQHIFANKSCAILVAPDGDVTWSVSSNAANAAVRRYRSLLTHSLHHHTELASSELIGVSRGGKRRREGGCDDDVKSRQMLEQLAAFQALRKWKLIGHFRRNLMS